MPGLVVDTGWLADHLQQPSLRLLDVRPADAYAQGHIPGGVQVELAWLSGVVDGVEGMLLPPDAYAQVMGRLGVGDDSTVVVYDANWGMPGARVLWGLLRQGHARVALLDGGWDRWREEDRPTSTEPVRPAPAAFHPRPADEHLATRAWLLARLDDPQLAIVDTRTPVEYAQGHLPGALSWDWLNGVPVGSWDAFRPAGELLAELAALGVTPDKEIVTYCRSGVRAAHTFVLLRHLGFPCVRNYDGSWLEWSRYPQQGVHA
jgi:thiosulfate/3-mercaptopyruvate sulfurtransferase